MNWPNRLSLIRIACVPVVAVLLVLNNLPWARVTALILFVLASATDYVDGHIARKYNLVTNFGKFIDPVADKLLVLSTMISLCALGYIPSLAVVAILIRELAVDGLRLVAVEQGRVIAAGPLGKIKTVTQMCMLVSYLLMHAGILALPVLCTILMYAAVVMALWSGADYFIRNKEVLNG